LAKTKLLYTTPQPIFNFPNFSKKGETGFWIIGIAIAGIIGLIVGLILADSPRPICTPTIVEKEKIVEIQKENLTFCVEYIKNADLMQKELYQKRWLNGSG